LARAPRGSGPIWWPLPHLAGGSFSVSDCLITATARVHNLTLVTRNVLDFADTGVDVANPWAA